MNDLSWLLYLADVIPKLGGILSSIGTVVAVAASFIFMILLLVEETKHLKVISIWALLGSSLLIVGALTPSRSTIYLIAGSEAGEYVVNSETGQEIIEDIQQVIQYQLQQLQGGGDE